MRLPFLKPWEIKTPLQEAISENAQFFMEIADLVEHDPLGEIAEDA